MTNVVHPVQERVLMVYQILPEDVTSIDTLWPLQLNNKDAKMRRDLSEQGKECFIRGEDNEKVLAFYNQAIMYR